MAKYLQLDRKYQRVPLASSQHMPTRLGNILQAFESRPAVRYGLNTELCWPRLWMLLPDGAKQEITEARSRLSFAAQVWIWGVLFTVWTAWAWWALPVGILTAILAYLRMLVVAGVYGELLESCFDIHRHLLYTALRWPLPATPAEEHQRGTELTVLPKTRLNGRQTRIHATAIIGIITIPSPEMARYLRFPTISGTHVRRLGSPVAAQRQKHGKLPLDANQWAPSIKQLSEAAGRSDRSFRPQLPIVGCEKGSPCHRGGRSASGHAIRYPTPPPGRAAGPVCTANSAAAGRPGCRHIGGGTRLGVWGGS